MTMAWYRSHDTLPLYEQDRDGYVQTPGYDYSGRGSMCKKNSNQGGTVAFKPGQEKNFQCLLFSPNTGRFLSVGPVAVKGECITVERQCHIPGEIVLDITCTLSSHQRHMRRPSVDE